MLVIPLHALKPHPTVAADKLPVTFNVCVFASFHTQLNDLHGDAMQLFLNMGEQYILMCAMHKLYT
jgi:hypothetical protein